MCNVRDSAKIKYLTKAQTNIFCMLLFVLGFPDSWVGKESAYNAGDPCSILGSGRSAGEGIGYPLQYSWASIVAQLVKNLLAMQETWVWSLSWEDPLEKRKATHSSIPAWRIPWTIQSMDSQRVGHNWATFRQHILTLLFLFYCIWFSENSLILNSEYAALLSTACVVWFSVYIKF